MEDGAPIPFFSLEARNQELRDPILHALANVLYDGQFIGGDHVTSFEDQFAAYLGCQHVVGVGNGLDALRLALGAVGVVPGDEVIVPDFTFIATWLAVSQLGATCVPVDVELGSANVSIDRILDAVTERTRAVVVVHLYGRLALSAADIGVLRARGLSVVEDAAQAHGAGEPSVRAGTLGDAAAFSFYPTKNLGGLGDGGAVATQSESIAARVRMLANYGATKASKYDHVIRGWNTRLDPVQAAVLSVFLPHLDEWNERRRALALRYRQGLKDLEEHFTIVDGLGSPLDSVWHHFVLRVEDRESLMLKARAAGIGLDIHYPTTPSESRAFVGSQQVSIRTTLSNSHALSRSVVSLPMYPQLPISDQDRIIDFLARSSTLGTSTRTSQ